VGTCLRQDPLRCARQAGHRDGRNAQERSLLGLTPHLPESPHAQADLTPSPHLEVKVRVLAAVDK
jgi:hypothetical protein